MVRDDGLVTTLEEVPEKLSGVMKDAEVVVAVASGIATPSPGIDIVRRDPKDAPYIYNTDHYMVVEKLTAHPDYLSFVRRAGVQDSEELRRTVNSWVWIVGPFRDPAAHWSIEVPQHIQTAKAKAEQAARGDGGLAGA